MRRPLTMLAVTATLVVCVSLPAWAQPSFVNDTAPVDTDVDLRLRAPDPEGLDTVGVDVAVPTAFTILGCSVPAIGWTCEVKGATVVFTAAPGAIDFSTFTVSVHTPTLNGAHAFAVTQRYDDNSSEQFTKKAQTAPVLNITGAPEPSEQPTEEPTATPSPEPTTKPSPPAGGSTTGTTPSPKPTPKATTTPAPGTSTGSSGTTGSSGSTSSNATSGGSAGPFRTQTSRGSSFDVTTGGSVPAGDGVDAPSIAEPNVSVAEPIAPDEVGDLESAGATTDAETEGSGPGRWIGLALLLAGGAAALAQRRMGTRT